MTMNNQLKSLSQLMLPRLEEEMRLVFKVNDSHARSFLWHDALPHGLGR